MNKRGNITERGVADGLGDHGSGESIVAIGVTGEGARGGHGRVQKDFGSIAT